MFFFLEGKALGAKKTYGDSVPVEVGLGEGCDRGVKPLGDMSRHLGREVRDAGHC